MSSSQCLCLAALLSKFWYLKYLLFIILNCTVWRSLNEANENIPGNTQDRGFHAVDMTTKTTTVAGQSELRTRRSQQRAAAVEGCDWTYPRPPTAHWLSGHDHRVLPQDPSTVGHDLSDGPVTQLYLCDEHRPLHRIFHWTVHRRYHRQCCRCHQTVWARRLRQTPGHCEFLADSSAGSPDNDRTTRYTKQLKYIKTKPPPGHRTYHHASLIDLFPHHHHHHYSACTISVRSSACYQ